MMNGSNAAAKAVALDATLKNTIAKPPDRMAAWLLFIFFSFPFFEGELHFFGKLYSELLERPSV